MTTGQMLALPKSTVGSFGTGTAEVYGRGGGGGC